MHPFAGTFCFLTVSLPLPHRLCAAPLADDPQLRETAYEMVLRSLLLDPQDHPMLLSLVRVLLGAIIKAFVPQ